MNERPFADARIILIDLETAPNLGYVWGRWEQDVIEIEKNWYILSFAWKVLGERSITCHALPDFAAYKRDRSDDRALVRELWRVLDGADICIAHNGDRFDFRKSHARFIAHGLRPPSPYRTIDTLKIARKHFKFDSNRLDDLGAYLGVGRKLANTGAKLWLGCMNGDKNAWRVMRRYNSQDVALLERVYLKLRPWATSHPRLTDYSRRNACPTCHSLNTQLRGWSVTRTGRRPKIHCADCGAWHTDTKFIREIA